MMSILKRLSILVGMLAATGIAVLHPYPSQAADTTVQGNEQSGLASALIHAVNASTEAIEQLAEGVRSKTLPNGLRVLLYRRSEAPIFAGVVAVRVGGSDEIPGRTGISHLLEHMAFKGTDRVGTADFRREKALLRDLEQLAAATEGGHTFTPEQRDRWEALHLQLEELWRPNEISEQYSRRGASGLNATTDKELTRYFVDLPTTAFEFWAWLESERILNPVMRQFYQERDVVLEERRMRFDDSPSGKLYETLLGVAFLQHPYRNPVIGYPSDLAHVTATEVYDFQRQYYVPANIVVAIVGDLDEESVWPLMERYFGRLPTGDLPRRPTLVEPPQAGERRVTLVTHGSREVSVVYRKPHYPHPDDAPLTVLLEMLAGGPVSLLHTELVKKQQIASQVGFHEGPGFAYPNLMMFHGKIKHLYSNSQFIDAFDRVVERFREEPIDPELMQIAKKALAMQHLTQLGSNMSLALQLASAELLYEDWQAIVRWYQEMSRVNVDDVKRVAREYLVNEARTIAVIEPAPNR